MNELLGQRYQLKATLAAGGMGQVYQAQDLVLKRPVAVKVLLPQFARDPGFVQRFRREAEAAAALNHENVVDVYDYGIERATQFIVMEFIEGRSLAEYIEGGGKIWPARSTDLAMNVAYALGAAHERGIVHRDIKPANVMVSRDGVVKVTDFGIAWVATDSAATGTQVAIGTAPYMSPEQAQAGPVDGRSDIYSLGCTLYHFVTGQPPFVGGDLASMLYRHVHEMPTQPSQLNPDVTTELDAVVMRCLSKNPAQRYQTARELNVALRRVGRGLPPYEWLQSERTPANQDRRSCSTR